MNKNRCFLALLLILSFSLTSFARESFPKKRNKDGEKIMLKLFGEVPKFPKVYDQIMPITKGHVFGEIWTRPQLSLRDRELVTLAALIGQGEISSQMKLHFNAALKNGVTPIELKELVLHVAYYRGFPAAFSAMSFLKEVLDEKKK